MILIRGLVQYLYTLEESTRSRLITHKDINYLYLHISSIFPLKMEGTCALQSCCKLVENDSAEVV